jgi:hypothetical protein
MKNWTVSGLCAACALTCAATTFASIPTSTLSVNGSPVVSNVATSTNREFTVNVNVADLSASAVGVQATVGYDDTLLEYVGIAGGDDLNTIIFSNHDTAGNKIFFASGVNPFNPGPGTAAGNVAKLTFRTVAAANTCADLDAIILTTGMAPTKITDADGVSLAFSSVDNVNLNSLGAFSLVNVPSNVSVAADAGTISGSLQSFTSPTASDSCGSALTVSFSRSDSAAASAYYPANATTTITWSATDAAGNSASGTTDVAVANYQLLDADVALAGASLGNSTRSVRFKAGASNQVVSVAMIDNAGSASGSATNLQVPIAAAYSCVSAKDVAHSLTDTAAASVAGVKWDADFVLKQGDSNNDDLVDILDFGIYVGDFGVAGASDVSNFNGDLLVNNADFGFISVNFLAQGEACGSFTGGNPRSQIAVRQLRRQGLGHLAAADLNNDGWLSSADIMQYMQFGLPTAQLSGQ